ncbi:MAG: RsmE family RNA methyltransferase [Kofleriaceae bacterium]
MNLLLVEPSELRDGVCVLADRRAAHLREVLGVAVGSTVKVGVLGGPIGTAEVVTDAAAGIELRFTSTGDPPPQLDVELVLAMPRPKALARVIEACAAFAIRRIDLTNAWRVDKSYLRSPKLGPEALAHSARLGAEQGATTHLPEIHVHERLMELLDARFADRGQGRLIAHPGATPIENVVGAGRKIIAIGPEGGWIDRELATFVERGFQPCSLGAPILRVESAVSAALGQLMLLDRIAER